MAQLFYLFDAVNRLDFDKLIWLVGSGIIDINCRDSLDRTVLHHMAVNAGIGEVVHFGISQLVALGANINARDMRGQTPLHNVISPVYAELAKINFKRSNIWTNKTEEELDEMINKRQIASLRHLVKLSADVNAKCNIGVSSLTRAIQFGNVRAAETLIKLGVNVNSELKINCSLLHSAVLYSRTKVLIKCLVELGADMESKCSRASLLHVAIKTQKSDINLLVQNGAKVNDFRDDNATPIILAVMMKNKEMIETLAQLGADINSIISSSSVIQEMVKLSETDRLQSLFKALGQNIPSINNLQSGQLMMTALGMAVDNSDSKMVEILVNNDADVNVRFDICCPPLFTAMRLGNGDIVTELGRLGGVNYMLMENTTALMRAVENACPRILELLLAHGGDVNLSYSLHQSPIQDAVRRGDTTNVKTLAKLGADINETRDEGIDLLYCALDMSGSNVYRQHGMEVIKMLVQAGINLNKGQTIDITLLHDAVKLGDTEMVHSLAEHGVDMNSAKDEGINSLCIATKKGMNEVIKYFVRNGANINQSFSVSTTPLDDAVELGNVDMVSTLIDCGAAKKKVSVKIITALNHAITNQDNDTVICLLGCGVDINQKFDNQILNKKYFKSPLHNAIDNSDLMMVETLVKLGVKGGWCMFSPLYHSVKDECYNIIETLIMFGADINSPGMSNSSLKLDMLDEDTLEYATLLNQLDASADKGDKWLCPLHAACLFGYIDIVRLLILEGGDVDKTSFGVKPLESLPLVNHVDYHVIKDLLTSSEVLCESRRITILMSECKNMKDILYTPGIGDVINIPTPQSNEISNRVYKLLDSTTTSCTGQLKAIGSAAEGTKVGLPIEMDFMIVIQMAKENEENIINKGNGYIKYEYEVTSLKEMNTRNFIPRSEGASLNKEEVEPLTLSLGSAGFHNEIMAPVFKHLILNTGTQSDEKITIDTRTFSINENDRKACSPTRLKWIDGNSHFGISVDLVPCLHVNNWPEGAITKTWLMDYEELRSHGYVLVPKPPHVKSKLAREYMYTDIELQTLWKVSFPHLETTHMQRLEQRVKDVYTTAKCLRNPDVCRILIRDDGSLPRPVDKYITSYLLKMCFFENVEYFQDDKLSLEVMVCKVYQGLVVHLSEGIIPIFFLPKVNALDGGKLDTHKCLQVAKIMARFVRGLYLRDSVRDVAFDRDVDPRPAISDEDEDITVYQRKPTSVYKVHDISDQ